MKAAKAYAPFRIKVGPTKGWYQCPDCDQIVKTAAGFGLHRGRTHGAPTLKEMDAQARTPQARANAALARSRAERGAPLAALRAQVEAEIQDDNYKGADVEQDALRRLGYDENGEVPGTLEEQDELTTPAEHEELVPLPVAVQSLNVLLDRIPVGLPLDNLNLLRDTLDSALVMIETHFPVRGVSIHLAYDEGVDVEATLDGGTWSVVSFIAGTDEE